MKTIRRSSTLSLLALAGTAVLLAQLTLGTHAFQNASAQQVPATQCNNGVDDDRDGLTDFPEDDGCLSALDDLEGIYPDSTNPLVVTVTDGKVYAQRGELLTYKIVVRNSETFERTYTLRSQLPTELNFVSGAGQYDLQTRSLEWRNQVIPARSQQEFFFTGMIERETPDDLQLRVRATAGVGVATDTTTVGTGVPKGALSVTVTDNQTTVAPGDILSYTITVSNLDFSLATDVDVSAALPMYTEFVDAVEGGYWTGSKVLWENMTVSPRGNRELKMAVRVRSDAPLGSTVRLSAIAGATEGVDLTQVAGVSDAQGQRVQRDVLLQKTADRLFVRPGDTVNYTIRVRNVLDHPMSNLKIEDRMDTRHARILSAPSGEMTGDTITWTVPVLAPGEEWVMHYKVQIDPAAPRGYSVKNVALLSGEGLGAVSIADLTVTLGITVVTEMPPTGAAFDALFLGFTALLGAAPVFAQRRKFLF